MAPIDNANKYQDLKAREGSLNKEEREALGKLEQAGYTLDKAAADLKDPQNIADYNAWKEGGTLRVAAHTVVGGITGGASGALGAATSQTVIPVLGEEIAKLDIPSELKKGLVLAASLTVGTATGGVNGAVAATNATANNYLKHTELVSKKAERDACKGDASCESKIDRKYDQISQERQATGDKSCGTGDINVCTGQIAEQKDALSGLEAGMQDARRQWAEAKTPEQAKAAKDLMSSIELHEKQAASLLKTNYAELEQRGLATLEQKNELRTLNAKYGGQELGLTLLGMGAEKGITSQSGPKKPPTKQEVETPKTEGANSTAPATSASDSLAVVAKPTYVFRGDGRSPAKVFDEGFKANGTNTDVLSHATTNSNSGLISTSSTPNVAREFADIQIGGYVYTVRKPPQALDVNATLGTKSPYPQEFEIAIPSAIRPQDILGARQVGADGKFVGSFIKNPGFQK